MANPEAENDNIFLSLSVRIAEGFLTKEVPVLNLAEVAEIAQKAGYQSICMRASQISIESSRVEIEAARTLLSSAGLSVSMVTGDFDIVYNNDQGPVALNNIAPYVALAEQLGAPMIRVALKKPGDIIAAREAADIAAQAGVKLVHQCHTLSLFETVDGIEETLRAIDRPNFGLIFEPANLELCGQDYSSETIRRLAPWIFNVYLQNQCIKPDGAVTLETWCRGPVNFDIIPIHQVGGINFAQVIQGLRHIEYCGPMTVHQSAPEGETPLRSAQTTQTFLQRLIQNSQSD